MYMIKGRFPTVPEYYGLYINKGEDLASHPKQCCPFHKEDTPSFSYDLRTGKWSCFGSCHAYGKDVIDMHQRFSRLGSREEAQKDLALKFEVKVEKTYVKQSDILLNKEKIDTKALLVQAEMLAKTPDRWVILDDIVSEYPINSERLYNIVCTWRNE